jgi:AcrR family transcriptional regulator
LEVSLTHRSRGSETRGRILAAALECFSRNGYDATGVAELCATAGISKGAFYHHFPSKQAVFQALLDQWLRGLDSTLREERVTGETVPDRLRDQAGLVQQVFEAAAGQLPMFLEFWRQAAKEPVVWTATIEPFRRFRAMFAALVAEGVAEGTLRPVDPELGAHVLVALGVGLVLQGVLDPTGADWSQVAGQTIQVLLEGLEQK